MEIKLYDTSVSFWELHPQLSKHSAFKDIYKKDKTKGHLTSSKWMWAFAAFVDISKVNDLRNLNIEERLSVINEDFLGNIPLDLTEHKIQLDEMSNLLLIGKRKVLANYLTKLNQRAELIEKTKYTLENAAELDKLIANTGKLFDAISAIESALDELDSDAVTKGGRVESASELGLL